MKLISATSALFFSLLANTSSLVSCTASSASSILLGPPSQYDETDVMMHMLQKKEKKNWPSRMLLASGIGGGGAAASPSMASQLDYNNHNIHLDQLEYTYGSSIAISFNLTNDLPIPTEVLQTLNTTNIDLWTLGIYMRMANPQGGHLPPIVTIQPNIVSLDSTTPRALLRHHQRSSRSEDAILDHTSRLLQSTADASNATGYYYEIIPEKIPVTNLPLPVLNYACNAIIPPKTTSATILDPTKYGTGFDIYLLDEFGRAILGPVTFYMIPTPAMTDALIKAEARIPNNGLAKFEKSKKEKLEKVKEEKKMKQDKNVKGDGNKSKQDDDKTKKKTNGSKGKEVVYDVNEDPSTVGLNSGVNGEMVITTTPKLAEYVLNTTQEYYNVGDTVVVMYNIKSDFDVLLGGGGGGDSSRRMMMKNSKKPSTAPTTKTLPNTTKSPTKKPISSSNAGPPPVPVPKPPPDSVYYKGIDGADVKLFSVGLYQRMANPQDGQLKPLLSVPLCSSNTNSGLCTKTAEQLKLGSVSFVVDSATVTNYGYGYDVWILNGAGVGVAGPYTFYINIPVTVLGEEEL